MTRCCSTTWTCVKKKKKKNLLARQKRRVARTKNGLAPREEKPITLPRGLLHGWRNGRTFIGKRKSKPPGCSPALRAGRKGDGKKSRMPRPFSHGGREKWYDFLRVSRVAETDSQGTPISTRRPVLAQSAKRASYGNHHSLRFKSTGHSRIEGPPVFKAAAWVLASKRNDRSDDDPLRAVRFLRPVLSSVSLLPRLTVCACLTTRCCRCPAPPREERTLSETNPNRTEYYRSGVTATLHTPLLRLSSLALSHPPSTDSLSLFSHAARVLSLLCESSGASTARPHARRARQGVSRNTVAKPTNHTTLHARWRRATEHMGARERSSWATRTLPSIRQRNAVRRSRLIFIRKRHLASLKKKKKRKKKLRSFRGT
ncbi:hypothetical protein PUN28_009020 [Cardiocondyla obscurior]|uniref:Uncharacterized protein n=1 Tax=Cardiocondyla obscurior TaxID=286306 RepID=A0AAW2FQI3_9HYME